MNLNKNVSNILAYKNKFGILKKIMEIFIKGAYTSRKPMISLFKAV